MTRREDQMPDRPALARLLRAGVLVLGTAACGVLAPSAAAQHKFYIYVDCPSNPFDPGHVFLQIVPGNGAGAGNPNLVWGFYPDTGRFWNGPGDVRQDQRHPWDYRICHNIGDAQYNAILRGVLNKQLATPNYKLAKFNCTSWVAQKAGYAGIRFPRKNRVGIDDPMAVWDILSQVGAGGVINGGVIEANTSGTAPNGGTTLACSGVDFSYERTLLDAHSDPTATAAALGLPLQSTSLGTLPAGLASQAVVFNNVALDEALVSVDWGDGSLPDANELQPTHAYAATGTYAVSIIAIDNAALHSYTAQLSVGAGNPNTPIAINVPTLPPVTTANPGCGLPLQTPPPIPYTGSGPVGALIGSFQVPFASTPVGLDSGLDGNLLMTAIGPVSEVHATTTAGAGLTSWVPAQTVRPVGVTFDGGEYFVTDAQGMDVDVYDDQGGWVRSFPVVTPFPEGLTWSGTTGNLYVVDSLLNQVTEYDRGGAVLATHGLAGSANRGIAWDPTDDGFWVYDSSTDRVRHYDSGFVQVADFPGTAAAGFGTGRGIAFLNGLVYVSAASAGRVVVFDTTGEAASSTIVGVGCPPAAPLGLTAGAPVLGSVLTYQATGVPPSPFGLLVYGFTPLSIPLDVFGLPGCSQYTSLDANAPFNVVTGQSALLLPNDAVLHGAMLHAQVAVFAPVNAFGLAVSNGVSSQLGTY